MHIKILVASMAFMGMLTGISLMVMFSRRVQALKAKQIKVRQFKTYETEGTMPEKVLQASRHYKNLLEMPILFYVIVLFTLWARQADAYTSAFALSYCFFRMIHSLIHLGSNNVFHRMRAFAGSFLALICMWFYVVGKFFL